MPKKHILPSVKAYRLMQQLFKENPVLNDIVCNSGTLRQVKKKLRTWALDVLCENKDGRIIKSKQYSFAQGMSRQKKLALVQTWWNDYKFHLKFAVRTPEDLNEMLDYSLEGETIANLKQAQEVGIPIFVNPYYLSLLDTKASAVSTGSDLAIRQYMIYSKELVNEFGDINAWEKEDVVEPGKPNAAGWLIPDDCIHR